MLKYNRFLKSLAIALPFFMVTAINAQIPHVVLISVDGLHPDMYLNVAWPTPNLQQMLKVGTYADYMKSVFPAYTYPSHTAMLTGALPARSKVCYNQPKGSSGEWNWEVKYIKVPTIWQVLHKNHLTTAAIMWPGSVGADIDYNLSEIWAVDRATEVHRHATKGLFEEIEQNATGVLDSNNMNDSYFSLDENAGRMAAYVFKKYKPNFLALHFATVDGEEHQFGRDADSVRLAVEANDRAIGEVMEAIQQSGLKDSTVVIIVGDHGFCNINMIFRPNMLIRSVKAKFMTAGGSAFLYRYRTTTKAEEASIIQAVTDSLNMLSKDKRNLFRIVNRAELDKMGADSSAILALAAVPGLVFSSSIAPNQSSNQGPGTSIQQNKMSGLFVPTTGGHHGYDPNLPEMYTGFIAAGAGIKKGGHIQTLTVTDIAPLIAKLLGVDFQTPDGKLPLGIISK